MTSTGVALDESPMRHASVGEIPAGGAGDAAPKRQASIAELLRRNPDLVKAMIASGLQRSAVMVATTLGVQNLRVMVWKEHTAEYMAFLTMTMSVLSMTMSGLFGRFGDRCGRRMAAIVYGMASFAPAWSLMAFGFNSTGLYVNSAVFVLGGFALGSDALLVLASEATLEEDRAMAFGLFQSVTSAVSFVLFGIPAMLTTMPFIHGVPKPSIYIWLWYQFGLGALFFFVVAMVHVRPKKDEADLEAQRAGCTDADRSSGTKCVQFSEKFIPMFSSIKMAWSNRTLRCLYIASFFLFFSGDVTFDLGGLYFRGELDLVAHGTLEEEQVVSVLSTLPPQLFVIPATAFTGFLAQRWGSMKLLKMLVPVSGIMTASAVVLALVPRIWVVPIVSLALNIAGLASSIPLKHLVAESAAEGHVGEAMGTLGMVFQAISFLCNAFVAGTTPLMYGQLKQPLWIYYLACGAFTVLALVPLRCMTPAADEDGVN